MAHCCWSSPGKTIIIRICDIWYVFVTLQTLSILGSYSLPSCLFRLWSKLQLLNDASAIHGTPPAFFQSIHLAQTLGHSMSSSMVSALLLKILTSELVEIPPLITASLVGPASIVMSIPLFTPPSIVSSVASPVISAVISSVVFSPSGGLYPAWACLSYQNGLMQRPLERFICGPGCSSCCLLFPHLL